MGAAVDEQKKCAAASCGLERLTQAQCWRARGPLLSGGAAGGRDKRRRETVERGAPDEGEGTAAAGGAGGRGGAGAWAALGGVRERVHTLFFV